MTLLGRRAECEVLDGLLMAALAGRSGVVVVRGEPGAGKSALLDYVSERSAGWQVATAVGVESEAELPYSGLHQLCAPLLRELDRLPAPQRGALATVFGTENGPAPDRFLVGLAALTLLAEIAEQQPLVCIIDDAQWIDGASAQVLEFVARRLLAERIALVCAARTGMIGDNVFSGLPELAIDGLADSDARALLLENVQGPLDAAVCEQIIAESHGNPLALLELPRAWNAAEHAGGFDFPPSGPVDRVEQSYAKRLRRLPADTRLLVLAAAAEPLGDPVQLHRAVAMLGLDMTAADPAVDAALLRIGRRVNFAHPLVRSAAYHSATNDDRRRVHHVLGEATDPKRDPDRRAWHRARAAAGPDERVAEELERSAGRAQARGGLAASAAFLERASALSPNPAKRARRALQAAEAKQLAGAPQAALMLLTTAAEGPLDDLDCALVQRLRGQITLDLRRGGEAIPPLLDAAGRLESIQPDLARETYLAALRAAINTGRLGGEMLRRVAQAARNARPATGAPRSIDLLLEGLAVRFTDGYAASATLLKEALLAVGSEDGGIEQDVRWPWPARLATQDLLDDETWDAFGTRGIQLARENGALGVLPRSLSYLAVLRSLEGQFDVAETLLEEYDTLADATGAARSGFARVLLAGFRGDEAAVFRLAATSDAAATIRGEGVVLTYSEHARAILYNGLGRYEAALPPAESASAQDELGVSVWSLPELIESATRSARTELAAAALERLTERTHAAGTEWAHGIDARSRALLSEGTAAEELYRAAVDHLRGTRLRPELARAHLLYGEWLRRAGRRLDARKQLHTAHDMLSAIGMEAFAERARRELLATGAKARKRTPDTRDDLTAQETQIAQLAREGYSNPEIGAQLFLSPRTVEWHLRKVFAKLNISSRRELKAALGQKTSDSEPLSRSASIADV